MAPAHKVHPTVSQRSEHKPAKPLAKFFSKHPSLAKFAVGSLIIAGLTGFGLASKTAYAQQLQPTKAPVSDTAKTHETRTLSARGKLTLLVEVMVFGIQKVGPEKALASLKIENKELGVSEDVTQVIFDITMRNLKNGVTDISKITDEVETRVQVRIIPIKPNETTSGKAQNPTVAVVSSK